MHEEHTVIRALKQLEYICRALEKSGSTQQQREAASRLTTTLTTTLEASTAVQTLVLPTANKTVRHLIRMGEKK